MLEEKGRVSDSGPQGVWVETQRQSACAGCSSANGCGQRLLGDWAASKAHQVLADNPMNIPLKPGDGVILGLRESSLLVASLLVYLLPLLTLALGALSGKALGAGEGLQAVMAGAGLVLGLAWVRVWVRRPERACRFRPQILRKSLGPEIQE